MLLRGNAGLAALLTGDTDAARDAFREELRLCRELVDLPYASEGLRGLAAVAAVARRPPPRARGSSAPQPRIATASHSTPSRPRLDTAFFEAARARAAEPKPGTPPLAKEAR